jgi:hypothetical protein
VFLIRLRNRVNLPDGRFSWGYVSGRIGRVVDPAGGWKDGGVFGDLAMWLMGKSDR